MFGNVVASLRDLWCYRFGATGKRHAEITADDEGFDARRRSDAEARVVSRTMGEPNGVRAWSKGDRR